MSTDLKPYLEAWESRWQIWRKDQSKSRPSMEAFLREAPPTLLSSSESERRQFCQQALYHELFYLQEVDNPTTRDDYAAFLSSLCNDPHAVVEAAFAELDLKTGESIRMPTRNPNQRSADANPGENGPTVDGFSNLEPIGVGAFGAVFRAVRDEGGEVVAIKVLNRDRSRKRDSEREAEILEMLRDVEGIITIHQFAQTADGQDCIVSEFIDGPDLEAFVKHARSTGHAIDLRNAVALVANAARAVHRAHEKGVWHRDLKPANLLIDKNGRVFVSDFGLALSEDAFNLDQVDPLGSPGFMSPEQARGEVNAVEGRSDVFSLGVILSVFLTAHTGRTPWRGNTAVEVIAHRANHPPLPPREIEGKIPANLNKIVMKAASVEMKDRHNTALDFAEDLERWLNPPTLEQVQNNMRRATGDTIDAPTGPPVPTEKQPILLSDDVVPHFVQKAQEKKLAVLLGSSITNNGAVLQSQLVEYLQIELNKPDMNRLADLANLFIAQEYHATQSPIIAKRELVTTIRRVAHTMPGENLKLDEPSVFPILANLPVAIFFTTSWFDEIEKLLTREISTLELFDSQHKIPPVRSAKRRRLVYLHGLVQGRLDQFMDASDDFESYHRSCIDAFEYLATLLDQGMTILCIGCTSDELTTFRYLKRALDLSDQRGGIYAITPGIDEMDAKKVWNEGRIATIDGESERTLLESIATRLTATSGQKVLSRPTTDSTASASIKSNIQEDIREARERMVADGNTPDGFFANFNSELPIPPDPPTHHQLNSVYVERGLKDWIIGKLEEGKNAGVTGLLGIGGVGKTYLALHIANELKKKREVIWVSLLQQGTSDALDALAKAYGLEFRTGLKNASKIIALQFVFERLKDEGRTPIIVLDNAERFPRIDALFHTLVGVPVLVTSRTEEGSSGWIEYRRLEPMNVNQGMELCETLLEKYGKNQSPLSAEDRTDLEKLCEFLGGHPLGIRLVIEGYLSKLEIHRKVRRPFQNIIRNIQRHGLRELPEARDLDTGRAGESLHKTLFSTFNWIFQDLPTISPEYGVTAQLVLPMLSAVGVTSVDRDSLGKAFEWLTEFVAQIQENEFRQSALKVPSLSGLIDIIAPKEGLRFDEKSRSLAEGYFNSIFGWTNQTDDEVRRERVNDVAELLSQWVKLQTIREARDSYRDCLMWHLSEWLTSEHRNDFHRQWAAVLIGRLSELNLESEEEISNLPWVTSFSGLTQPDIVDGALACLHSHALIEFTDDPNVFSVHPLIREFAFEERSRSSPVTIGGKKSQYIAENGPTLVAIYNCVLKILPLLTDSGDSFLDLLPRLKSHRELAEFACIHLLQHGESSVGSNLKLLLELYEAGVSLAEEFEFIGLHGRLLAQMGEYQHRLGDKSGLELMEQAVDILQPVKDPVCFKIRAWISAYLFKVVDEGAALPHLREVAASLRDVYSHDLTDQRYALQNLIGTHLAIHSDHIPMEPQLYLTSCWSNRLDDASFNLRCFFEACSEGTLTPELFNSGLNLVRSIQNAESSGDSLGPWWALGLERDVIFGSHYFGQITDEEFDERVEALLQKARKSGFQEEVVTTSLVEYQWTWHVRNRDWVAACSVAERWLAVVLATENRLRDYHALLPHLKLTVVKLAAACETFGVPIKQNTSTPNLTEISSQLDEIEKACEHWGRNECIGWLKLARALMVSQLPEPDLALAAKFTIQARESFRRYHRSIPTPANAVYDHCVSRINQDQPGLFDDFRDKLGARVDPPDYRPWLIGQGRRQNVFDGGQLPARVRSKRDGKNLRLVEGGLQCCPDGIEGWQYPFYIDEECVKIAELKQFANETNLDCQFEGDETSFAGIIDPKQAVAYAEWSGKQLPNVREWYAATWQLAFHQKPEIWETWKKSDEGQLKRIENAIKKNIQNPHTPLPSVELELESSQKETLQYFFSAQWLKESPALLDSVQREIVARVAKHEDVISGDVANGLAFGLASSISLTWEEKSRIIAAIPELTKFQIEELVKILEAERAKFLELDEHHLNQLLSLGWRHRTDFVQILLQLDRANVESIDPTKVFTRLLPTPGSPQDQPQPPTPELNVRPMFFSADAAELLAVWSCQKSGWEEQPEIALLGDPFKDAEWKNNGRLPRHNFLRPNSIGLRCVIPIYTTHDLEQLEPLE